MGGPIRPAKAAHPPAKPPKREPNTKERLTILGPGRIWQSAKVSLNSSAVIQRCWSTMLRRAQASTPPKPASDILAKARNSSIRPGRVAGMDAPDPGRRPPAANLGGMVKSRTALPARPSPVRRFHGRKRGLSALFFSTFAPYIEGAGLPAMEINGRRNKPFGPGGSTRRLHPSPNQSRWRVSAGAKQDRRGRKGRVFSRYGSAVIGLCNSCKRQLCSGCSGCVTQFERPNLKS